MALPKLSTSADKDPCAGRTRLEGEVPEPGGQTQAEGEHHGQDEGVEGGDAVPALDPQVEEHGQPDHQRHHFGQREHGRAPELDTPEHDGRGVTEPAAHRQLSGQP